MGTSTVGSIRAALKTLIAAQLSGVNVYSFPPGENAFAGTASYEFVTLAEAQATQTHLVFGGARMEEFTLSGLIWVAKSGTGDTQYAAAENRALVLLAGVEDALRTDDTPGTAFHGQISSYRVQPGATDTNVWCSVEFDIEIESHI